MKLNWNFWRGGRVQSKKTFCGGGGGGGMDIFWNHTFYAEFLFCSKVFEFFFAGLRLLVFEKNEAKYWACEM